MSRRHGIWRCTICDAELLAKPSKTGRKHHDKLHTYSPRDHVGRWLYEERNDRFLHRHDVGWQKLGVFRAEFVEDLS